MVASVRLELDRVLEKRARARRWRNDGGRVAYGVTAHDGVEIAWLDAGGMRYRVGGLDVELGAGAVMVVPSGLEHQSEFLPAMRGGSLHVDDAVVAEAADAAGARPPRAACLVDDGADVRALGAMLVAEMAKDSADARLCAGALVDALAVKVVRGLPPVPASVRDPRVRAAVDVIRARFAEPIDVDDIAAACGTSRFHLSRLFKAATGASPYRFLIDVRLEESARLLRRGRSVTDAALSSGFSDLSRFARMFSRRYGCLPKAYASTVSTSASSTAPLLSTS